MWVCVRKNGSRETAGEEVSSCEVSLIIQAKDEGGLEQAMAVEGGNSGCILAVEPTGFAVGLDAGYEGRNRISEAS